MGKMIEVVRGKTITGDIVSKKNRGASYYGCTFLDVKLVFENGFGSYLFDNCSFRGETGLLGMSSRCSFRNCSFNGHVYYHRSGYTLLSIPPCLQGVPVDTLKMEGGVYSSYGELVDAHVLNMDVISSTVKNLYLNEVKELLFGEEIITKLPHLETYTIEKKELRNLPVDLSCIAGLKELDISGTSICLNDVLERIGDIYEINPTLNMYLQYGALQSRLPISVEKLKKGRLQ